MTLFERIKNLSERKDKNVKEVAIELGFSENLFYKWKSSDPKGVDLEKVADYFDVSVDYLLGRKEKTHNEELSMAKQVMMRMETNGLSEDELNEIESEMERFFSWRLEEIKREKEK